MTAPYRWKIDKDFLEGDAEHGSVGAEGPRGMDVTISDNPKGFTLYDDDDIAYYHGWLYGDYSGFEPVDDYGMPYAGAVNIKFDGDKNYL